ncbi:MAG: hypothetical protein EXS35_05870 [Pedosphaera sp.]|nr:hypothetical protein [Pedosphaera sp.]
MKRLCLLLLTGLIVGSTSAKAGYIRYVGAPGGGIYLVGDDTQLSYFRHQPETSAPGWSQDVFANGGWDFEHLIYNGNGILYAANVRGELIYYRDDIALGVHTFTADSGTRISLTNVWAEYVWLLGDGDGVIYAIDQVGRFYFYQHSQTATTVWPTANGVQIGSGWGIYNRVISGRQGVIYAINEAGEMYYYRDRARNGTIDWEYPTGLYVGNGWNRFQNVFSTGNGNIYGVDEVGNIFYYHLSIVNGAPVWTGSDIVNPINPGASAAPRLHRGVYCWPPSGAPGDQISFKISLGGATRIRISRLIGNATETPDLSVKLEPALPITTSLRLVPNPNVPARRGCGWPESYSLTIPADWESGIYLFQCFPAGEPGDRSSPNTFETPFVVKPAVANRGRIACLANLNTWNSYNAVWGGSHYYNGRAILSFLRPTTINSGLINTIERASISHGEFHLGAGELWVTGWLEANGYRPDMITDLDFHNGYDMSSYRALVIDTHPEYWSDAMYLHLKDYLEHGGSLIYLGGNGIYERVAYSPDQTTMIMNDGDEAPTIGTVHEAGFLFREATAPTMNERDLLGVATAACSVNGGGYTVLRPAHPFLANVTIDPDNKIGQGWNALAASYFPGLHQGPRAGFPALNGMAAGFESDNAAAAGFIAPGCSTTDDGAPTGVPLNPIPTGRVVLAKAFAANPPTLSGAGGGDAEMSYFPHPAGGLVFSVGSITFGGMLMKEPGLAQLMRNVLAEACTNSASTITIAPGAGPNIYNLSFHRHPGAVVVVQQSKDLLDWSDLYQVDSSSDLDLITLPITADQTKRFYRLRR